MRYGQNVFHVFQCPFPSPRKIVGSPLLPPRCGGTTRSGKPSPFMSATEIEFRPLPVEALDVERFSEAIEDRVAIRIRSRIDQTDTLMPLRGRLRLDVDRRRAGVLAGEDRSLRGLLRGGGRRLHRLLCTRDRRSEEDDREIDASREAMKHEVESP